MNREHQAELASIKKSVKTDNNFNIGELECWMQHLQYNTARMKSQTQMNEKLIIFIQQTIKKKKDKLKKR